MDNDRETKRCAEAPEDQAGPVRGIEVRFAMPVNVTRDQERRLRDLVEEIIEHPSNQPEGGVHWLAGYGSKPIWNEPQEPDFDNDTLFMESAARPFVSEEEGAKEKKRRERLDQLRDSEDKLGVAIREWLGHPGDNVRYRVAAVGKVLLAVARGVYGW